MTLNEVRKLHPGDKVYWNDLDGGTCSRVIKIQSIEIRKSCKTVILTDVDGSALECFASELS